MLTLNDYAKLSNDPYQVGMIEDMLRYSDLAKIVPVQDVPGMRLNANRWQTLPGAAFRKFGGGYTESSGTTEQFTETLSILGGDIKFDRLSNKGSFVEDPIVTAVKMKVQATMFVLNNSIINGDHAVDADGFEGLKKRISNMSARQMIWLDANGNGTGASLKVLASEANEQAFLDALHKAIKRVGVTHFLCNETSVIGLGQVLRRLKLNTTMKDAYDYVWDTFDGKPLVDVGLKGDQSTEIIADTEPVAANDSSSIYGVRFDTDDGVRLIQMEGGGGPTVYDPLGGKEMEIQPAYLRRFDWPVGMFHKSKFSIIRIAGFKMAAS